MTTANEASGKQNTISTTLESGLEIVGTRQTVEFQMYTKSQITEDGFVFWVATSQFTTVIGALHLSTDRVQEEDQTIAVNQVLLTTEQSVEHFNAIAPGTMWVGSWPVGPPPMPDSGDPPLTIQVAFSRSGAFFRPANLYHYSGFAVYPALSAQLIQTEDDLPAGPIVNNSLPIWLAITTFQGITVPVYPSFLVPDNVVPPYVVAHIEPGGTIALQAFPVLLQPATVVPGTGPAWIYDWSASQLMRDEVDLILYGFTAQMAMQYLINIYELSVAQANFGFANLPAIMDEKRTQPEIAALAQKKMIHVTANYNMGVANAVARRLILSAGLSSITFTGVGTRASFSVRATGVACSYLQFGATGVAS